MKIYFFFLFSVVLACCRRDVDETVENEGNNSEGSTSEGFASEVNSKEQSSSNLKANSPKTKDPKTIHPETKDPKTIYPETPQGSDPQPKSDQNSPQKPDLIIRKPANWKIPSQFSLTESINQFNLTPTPNPKIFLCKNSILNLNKVTIVNAANRPCLGGGGIDGQIHKAAGPTLAQEIRSNFIPFSHTINGQIMNHGDRIVTGGALITGPHSSKAASIIHTAGPDCRNKEENSKRESLLTAAYTNSLRLAELCAVKVVAFPLVSGEIFQYPAEEQCRVACESVGEFFLQNPDSTVEGVIFVFYPSDLGDKAFTLYQKRLAKQ